jgi:hypothetical protein
VGARRADGQHLRPAPYQHDRLAGGVPEERALAVELGFRDTLGQIWPGKLRLSSTHAA